ncbi:hypothetical protein TPENAI_70141 [Tenacibaculum litopenaei]|uniref:hypothetical protein n=1 Tax=Tenacibaculum litopenaei TaxID=396016 RepID=UPI003894089E
MTAFKTLNELNEFNKKGFEPVFGLKKIEHPESPFKEGSFDNLKFNARPHEVFKLDWKTFNSIDFADKFLPYIKNYYKEKGMRMYDGAELFNGLKKTERKLFTFDDHEYLISLINYTYPKGVLAQERKDRVKVSDNEVLTFIEVDENETIDVSFKFGKRFKNYLNQSLENNDTKVSIESLEQKIYRTDKKIFQNFFNQELVHDSVMRYVLITLGVKKEATELAEFNALFSKKVTSFMEDFTIADKYKPYVFIEKSQRDVQLKTDNTINAGVKVAPKPNEIYIWLVHKDSSFILIQFGTNVAKDLKKREITQEYLEDLISNLIKVELENQSFSKGKIDAATNKGLGRAMTSLYILEDLKNNSENKEVFKVNPALYLGLKATKFAVDLLDSFRFEEYNWNPRIENYQPLIEGDTLLNAQFCGLINGMIDQVKAVPQLAAFLAKMQSPQELEKFVKAIKKMLDEGIFTTLLQSSTKEYQKALQEGNVERLYYNLAHDIIAIISLFLLVYQIALGVSNLINFIGKSVTFIKRFGRKGLNKLKKLNKKQLKEVFDDLDDPKHLRVKLKTVKMKSNYIGEETGINSWCAPSKVKYFDEFERIKYKLTIKDGKLFDNKGVLFDTSKAGTIHSGKGRVMFVMDENGIIYASKFQIRGKLHHSSFLAGKPVASAGELKVVNGIIKEISRKSGHYKPSKAINKQIIKVLKTSGVETKSIKIINGF